MGDMGKAVFVGVALAAVPFFGFGAAAGSIIQEGKTETVSVDVGGHTYDACAKVDTHTWRCTP